MPEVPQLLGLGKPPSLLQLCVQKLAQNLIKYGPKRVRFTTLSALPRRALEALLDLLVQKNALNDNVLPHALTRQTQKLGLEGAVQLRRCVLNTIGRSCPNLRILDVRTCQQVDNRIVRDVLQYCEHLEVLRLDGCTRISDSAFAPALWKPPLAGLLGLRELSIGKCGQVTAEGLLGNVLKGAPYLRTLGLAFCKLTVTDEVASELLFQFGLQAVDLSFCTQISNVSLESVSTRSPLRELRLASTHLGDDAVKEIARRLPQLEVFDLGWVMKLTDDGILAVAEHCKKLRTLCVCNTQITDSSFHAIVTCRQLESLNASWCLRASARALDILSDPSLEHRPPLRELELDHLGSMNLDIDIDKDVLGPLPQVSGLFSSSSSLSPLPVTWLPMRLPPEPPSMLLPPPAVNILEDCRDCSECPSEEPPQTVTLSSLGFLQPPMPVKRCITSPPSTRLNTQPALPCLKTLVSAYGASLEQLLLDDIQNVANAAALEAIATGCPVLQQLAVTLTAKSDADDILQAALCSVGRKCSQLSMLRIDASSRAHGPVVESLKSPFFGHLSSLTLWCSSKGMGLKDTELETILSGRTLLKTLVLRNCEGLSEGLFPKWCNRGEKHDDTVARNQLDQTLLASLSGLGMKTGRSTEPMTASPVQIKRRRQHLRSSAATTLRSVTYFSLGGACSLTDRSCDALAELLHDAQTVDVRGSPLLTEDTLRSFRKGCRFIRSVSVVTRERTLTWTATTSSSVKKHSNRKRSSFASGSSGTESN
mmetsp:Transcript_81379/g.143639  ORF Transcript_81379/g.143639 Transcript_81379/m.143639 type:complete len:764 (-) Transcript_81379:33-2324(-)